MTTNHIDQLAEWWENAAPITENVDPGTVIIGHMADGSYEIFTEFDRNAPGDYVGGHTEYRVLSRAPKPKPAWHDADYVIARADGKSRRVWGNNRLMKRWEDGVSWSHAEDLRDVTPLIEAKVTDEMRDRVRDYYRTEHQVELPRDDVWLNELLTVALGLETE